MVKNSFIALFNELLSLCITSTETKQNMKATKKEHIWKMIKSNKDEDAMAKLKFKRNKDQSAQINNDSLTVGRVFLSLILKKC